MEIKRGSKGNETTIVVHDGNAFITSQSVEANLLFAILEKLEEIRCGVIDVEQGLPGWR